jgi:hypothetical protein
MYVVFESEMLHRREYLTKRIENLCHGKHLPVEVPAVDNYGKGIICLGLLVGIEIYMTSPLAEIKPGPVELDVLLCVHELQETRNRKCELLEELNDELLEARSGDSANNLFQVSANTPEEKPAEVRKCDVCQNWSMYELPLHITIGNREYNADQECLQLWHE